MIRIEGYSIFQYDKKLPNFFALVNKIHIGVFSTDKIQGGPDHTFQF
jgi:hypothetical protein